LITIQNLLWLYDVLGLFDEYYVTYESSTIVAPA